MKNVFCKITALLTVLALAVQLTFVGSFSVSAESVGGQVTDSMTWRLEDGVLRIEGTGDMPDFGWIDSVPWSSYRESITQVNISTGVTSIGNYVFAECSSLRGVEIPEGVTSIGIWAFFYCSSLAGIELPESVTSIGNGAFQGCSSLRSIEIPKSVTSIGDWALEGCSRLTDAIYGGRPEQWKKVKIGNNNDVLLAALRIVIPGDINGDGVVTVEDVTALLQRMAADAKIPGYCDLNGDGKVTVKDVSRLLRMLEGV